MEPPYDEPEQAHAYERMQANLKRSEEDEEYWEGLTLKSFLAGGGERSEFDKVMALAPKWKDIARRQIENKELYSCGAGPFYIVKGSKPK